MSYEYLLDIALILLSTKVLGLIVKKFHMPQVVGALLAGIILGPALLNILHETRFLEMIAELGVIVILFTAGMDTDLGELRKAGKAGFTVALTGVIVPLIMGAGLMYLFNYKQGVDRLWLQNFFMGVILTATSVSITVETLKELGKLSTKVGNTILSAALVDDILGLIALTLISGVAGSNVNLFEILLKILLFFVFALVISYIAYKVFTWYSNQFKNENLHRFPVAAFVLCLLMSFCAEHFFGVADIIGAFIAGLVIARTPKVKYISSKFSPLSYLLLTPVFFASIGMKAALPQLNWTIILFSVLLVIVAILSKLVGCGLGAKLCHFTDKECIQVGIGMACRGEVSLIVADKGVALGIISPSMYGPVIIMVVIAAVITPVLLKIVFRRNVNDYEQSSLVENYEKTKNIDLMNHQLYEQKK